MQDIIEVDNFLQYPDAVRQDALQSSFLDWEGFDGQVYKRVCSKEVPGLRLSLEAAIGPVKVLGMGYRLNYEGEEPNQAIHSDMGWGTHALVLYLTEGEGGTAFWEHMATGTTEIQAGDNQLYQKINGDWDQQDKWAQYYMTGMKYNRAVIYRSALFHSRYPFQAFGSTPETGRLIAVAFFNKKRSNFERCLTHQNK